MKDEFICSHRYSDYFAYDIERPLVVMAIIFSITFPVMLLTDVPQYLIMVTMVDLHVIPILLVVLLMLPLIWHAIRKYTQYRELSEAELYPAGPKCRCFTLLLEFLDRIASADKLFFRYFVPSNAEIIWDCLESLQSIDQGVLSDLKVILSALRIDLGDKKLRRLKKNYLLGSAIILMSAAIVIFSLFYIIYQKGFASEFFIPLILLISVFWIIGIVLDRIYVERIEKMLSIDKLDDPEIPLLAKKIIERLLMIISCRISKPIVLFLRSRYKHLSVRKTGLGNTAFLLEPSKSDIC